MLKCDEFIGCYGSCEKEISTGIIADFTGEYNIEYTFNNAKKKIISNAIQDEEIKIPNNFTPGIIHCVELKKTDKTKIKNLSFKIYSQCL